MITLPQAFELTDRTGCVLCELKCVESDGFITAEIVAGELPDRLKQIARDAFAAGNSGVLSELPHLEQEVQKMKLRLSSAHANVERVLSVSLRDDGFLMIAVER